MADWQTDIQAAQDAHIDAFALNMAVDSRVAEILPTAFQAAHDKHFSLFFSFDYAGNGPWKAGDVAALLEQYTASRVYYLHKGQYLVSTFEGPAHAEDWIDLKQQYNVFFVPDWSSIGAKPASQLGGGVADALFSWAAWPWGPQDMDTYTDASYYQYLNESGSKPYMMAVSPWFFTNLPGYDKNWLWRGDDLWYDRWVQVFYNQPEFVEIISCKFKKSSSTTLALSKNYQGMTMASLTILDPSTTMPWRPSGLERPPVILPKTCPMMVGDCLCHF